MEEINPWVQHKILKVFEMPFQPSHEKENEKYLFNIAVFLENLWWDFKFQPSYHPFYDHTFQTLYKTIYQSAEAVGRIG